MAYFQVAHCVQRKSKIPCKQFALAGVPVLVLTVLVYYNYTPFTASDFVTPRNDDISSSLFVYTLSKTADVNKDVILAFVDYAYLDLGINLYLSSIKPLGLTNHLFLGSDPEVCPAFKKVVPEVNCVQVANDRNSKTANAFASRGFTAKNWRKVKVVYEVLQLGFNVLLVDLDIVMFKNPFPFFDRCPTCDIQIQFDHVFLCGGFYFVRSTNNSLELFKRTWARLSDFITGKRSMKQGDFNEQLLLTDIIKLMNKTVKGFKPLALPEKVFANGYSYFIHRKIMFGTDSHFPTDVYIVHNNWIVYASSKVYRFRENFMWYYDKDGYYSDKTRKYLQFDNTLDVDQIGNDAIHELEKETLQAAFSVGFLLNRTVILPSFTCKGCSSGCFSPKSQRCALNKHFKVPHMERYLNNRYREHTFLQNTMVPEAVKTSVSKTIVIESDFYKKFKAFYKLEPELVDVYRPQDPSKGASHHELLGWLSKYSQVSVLKFHNLYHSVQQLPNEAQFSSIKECIKQGVALSVGNYMQGGNG